MTPLIIASVSIMLVSLIGAISIWKHIGDYIEKHLTLLVSFSAGVFLIIALSLVIETVEHAPTYIIGFGWILLGALILWIIFNFLPTFHHHHDNTLEHNHAHSKIDTRKILISDALHNIGDGILLSTTFAINIPLGITATLSILIHELIQEISEFFVLRQAGYTAKKALILNFIVSSTILIGALGGYFLLDQFESFEVPLLGLAGGAFLIVVLHDLIPHSVRHCHVQKKYKEHIIWFTIGLILMTVVNIFTGH